MLVDQKYIDSWTLIGPGKLDSRLNKGTYTAPTKLSAETPALVEVVFRTDGIVVGRVLARIFVVPEGISIRIDGGDWQTFDGDANSTQNIVAAFKGGDYISLGWKGRSPGTYAWTLSADVAFSHTVGTMLYQHVYIQGNKPLISGGSLIIAEVGPAGGDYVVGSFTLSPAGWTRATSTGVTAGTASIEGIFRVKRLR